MNKILGQTALSLILIFGSGAMPAAAQTVWPSDSQTNQNQAIQKQTDQNAAARNAPRATQAPRKATAQRASARHARAQEAPARVVVTPRARRAAPVPAVQQRVVVRSRPETYVPGAQLQLSPAQRNIVYRDLMAQPVERPVERPVAINRVVVPANPWWPAYPTQTVVTASEPDVTVYDTEPTTTGEASDLRELVVGASVPGDVPLYNMPAHTVAAMPALGNYLYAVVYDRAYIVDPADGVVIAELYR